MPWRSGPPPFGFPSPLSLLAVPNAPDILYAAAKVRTQPICLVIFAAIAMAVPLVAQDFSAHQPGKGHITDTVIDPNDETVSGATIVLEGPVPGDPRVGVSDENGFFEFDDLDPGTYSIKISARGF